MLPATKDAVSNPFSVNLTASTHTSANVAASIVQSTTSLGIAYQKAFDSLQPLVLIGGGARSQTLSVTDLAEAVPPEGEELNIKHSEYVLIDYVPLAKITRNGDTLRDCIVCQVPLSVIMKKMKVEEVRDLCKLHGIHATTRDTRRVMEGWLSEHRCSDACEVSYAVLRPHSHFARSTAGGPLPGILDVESLAFADTFKILSRDDILPLLSEEQAEASSVGYRVKRVARRGAVQLNPGEFVLDNIPLSILAKFTTIQGMRSLGSHHGFEIPSRWAKEKCEKALQHHKCENCLNLHFILTPVNSVTKPRQTRRGEWLDSDPSPFLWESEVTLDTASYPPKPTTMHDIAVAMRGYCEELTPDRIEEEGCCVCGQLTRRSHMLQFDETAYDLSVLEQLNCTRLERFSPNEPITDIKGPVLDSNLTKICPTCHDSLKRNRRPKFALANFLWLGQVPDCLKDLTLGECALISRVRYNRCVVRVLKGHAKMVANVISFEHPSKKIYERLPMPKEELADVLSIIYTGTEPPGDDDLKRTPVLVRKERVRAALEWLKLNHKDYADLSIDYETLGTYALEGVPIGLFKKNLPEQEGNVLASQKSVFQSDEDQ
ncbi:hypothetical protein DFP72DRAFT_826233, partial [Ephemerocybe angulata]